MPIVYSTGVAAKARHAGTARRAIALLAGAESAALRASGGFSA